MSSNDTQYKGMTYRRSGRSGLMLPVVSLGLWHNFGGVDIYENMRLMCRTAYEVGITHFDLANNYGPPPGSAEENFARVMVDEFGGGATGGVVGGRLRDELIISTKAGYKMWDGPYGSFGSRKYLLASLEQSLRRMKLDYVDIFYSHRPDHDTPLEETIGALESAVKQGKALYTGISNYPADMTARAAQLLRQAGTPCLIHQPVYNMMNRWIEKELLSTLEKEGVGCIVFSPLAQGMLTERYLGGLPGDSRAVKSGQFLKPEHVTEDKLAKIRQLADMAKARGQTLAQMALAWCLRHGGMTSVLIGASKPEQIRQCAGAIGNLVFSADELAKIDGLFPA